MITNTPETVAIALLTHPFQVALAIIALRHGVSALIAGLTVSQVSSEPIIRGQQSRPAAGTDQAPSRSRRIWRPAMNASRSLLIVAGALLALGVAPSAAQTDPGDWPMAGHDSLGTRHNAAETILGAGNARNLAIEWSVPTEQGVHGTPAVVDGTVYAVDASGTAHALEAATGRVLWTSRTSGINVTTSPLVIGTKVIFGDFTGVIYALDRASGKIAWTQFPNPHGYPAIYGPATSIATPGILGPVKRVLVGIASNEETVIQHEAIPCCRSRGSVVSLDPETGVIQWQTYMISDAEAASGASGASVWTMPVYDPEHNLVYVTTGNNFSEPVTGTSDAFVAMDANDGHIVWVNQRTPNDTFVFHFNNFSAEHPDADFGDSAQIHRLPNGRKVVTAGQKSGFMHMLDAVTGERIDHEQFVPGGGLGGLFADSAVVGDLIFANGHDWQDFNPAYFIEGTPGPREGYLVAIRAKTRKLEQSWRFVTPGSANLAGVAVANGVVYFHSSHAGKLYALDAQTGAELAAVEVGKAINGPSVSHGMVFVGTGDTSGISNNAPPEGGGGSITALGLP